MKIYYFICLLLRPAAVVAFYVFNVLTHTPRVRVVVQNENSQILFVQTALSGNIWGFPGGGVERDESFEQAACRELHEETGITVRASQLHLFDTIYTQGHAEAIFLLQVPSSSLPTVLPNKYEIKNAAWFAVADVPHLYPVAKDIALRVADK